LFEVSAVAHASMTQTPLAQCANETFDSFVQSRLHCPQWAVSVERSIPPMHGPHAESTPLLQVRVCVPVQLQDCDSEAAPQFCPMHEPHWQVAGSHVAVPPLPHDVIEFGAQAPWLPQADHEDHSPVEPSQVRVCVPQLPQLCEPAPAHTWFPQELHRQVPPHDWVPLFWQPCVVPAAHSPSPAHADQADHVPVPLSQVRVCVPQWPQAWVAAPGQV
jgi:hypothetical protein